MDSTLDPRLYQPLGLSAPPDEYYAKLDGTESAEFCKRVQKWRTDFENTWNLIALGKYLCMNNKDCQDLSDEELNQFRKNQ